MPDSSRVQVLGFGRSQAQKAVWMDKKLQIAKEDAIIRPKSGLPKKLSLPDEATKFTLDVNFPTQHGIVPKGSSLHGVKVIAGDGTSIPIRDLPRLVAMYPNIGSPTGWQKKVGKVETGYHVYDIHWYENDGICPAGESKIKGLK